MPPGYFKQRLNNLILKTLADAPGRITSINGLGRNIAGDYRFCCNNRPITNGDLWHDNRFIADPDYELS